MLDPAAGKKWSPKQIGFPCFEQPLPAKKRVRTDNWMKKVVLVALLAAGICMGYVYQINSFVRLGYQVDSASTSVAAMQQENKLTALKIISLQSPARIEELATGKLGMVKPQRVLLESIGSRP
jgi:cell division protein FtsB